MTGAFCIACAAAGVALVVLPTSPGPYQPVTSTTTSDEPADSASAMVPSLDTGTIAVPFASWLIPGVATTSDFPSPGDQMRSLAGAVDASADAVTATAATPLPGMPPWPVTLATMRLLSPLSRSCARRHRCGTPAPERVSITRTGPTGVASFARPGLATDPDAFCGGQYGTFIGLPDQKELRPLAPSQVSEMWMWLR